MTIKWKWLAARSVAFYSVNESSENCIQEMIKKHMADGWFLKGEMTRASATSEIWVQRMGKSFPAQN